MKSKDLYFIWVLFISCMASAAHPKGQITSLNGEWSFIPNDFITFQEIEKQTPLTLNVPGTWNSVIKNGKGYGTFYRKIKLNNSQNLALQVPLVGLSYEVYLDDHLIGKTGQISRTEKFYIPQTKPKILKIPELGLNEAYIIFHISNFDHQNGGLWFTPKIGNEEALLNARNRKVAIDIFILGAVSILGIYFLLYFIIRPKEQYGIYFFFICICLLMQLYPKDQMPIFLLFPDLSWKVLLKMDYISLFSVAAFNLLFVFTLLPDYTSKTIVRLVSFISFAAISFTLLASSYYSYYLVMPFQLITVLAGLYLVYVLYTGYKSNVKGSGTLLIGLTIALISVVNDVCISNYLYDGIILSHYGTLIYVVSLSVVLAKRFLSSVDAEEILKSELEIAYNELEVRVIERTDELERQKELVAKQNRTLSRVNDELKHLLTIVAHDLKSPLSKIYGIADLMRRNLDGKHAVMNDHIIEITESGINMINDLITSRSFEIKGIDAIYKVFNYQKVVLLSIQHFKEAAEKKEITIDAELENFEIKSDPELIRRIVDNILSNAIKYSYPQSKIIVKLYTNGIYAALSVKDFGPGFTSEDKRNIFKSFQKLSARPTAGESSSGLGLSIVKTLTDELDGIVELISEEEKGAEFTIKIPLMTL